MSMQIESYDSGSNYRFQDKLEVNNPSRSLLDLTHSVSTTIDNAGVLQVLNWLEMLPKDSLSINASGLLRVLPQEVPLYSRQRLYIYAFAVPYPTVWNNWQTFTNKGYTGTVDKIIPTFNNSNLAVDSAGLGIQPGSLGNMLGLPIGMTRDQIIGCGINCLPAYGLLRIWRDYFINKHYRKSDRVILPEDDSRFRCNDSGLLLSAVDESKYLVFDLFSPTTKGVSYDSLSSTYTVGVLYHEYPQDYFRSAVDSPQHGEAVPLDFTQNAEFDFSQVFLPYASTLNDPNLYTQTMYEAQFGDNKFLYPSDTSNSSNAWAESHSKSKLWVDTFNKAKLKNLNLKIYLEDLRNQSINQTILEQLAKTDGSYGEFVLNQFGIKPRSAMDFTPYYIGGTYQNIQFTEVLQTVPASGSPLGSYAGHGISGVNNDYLGSFDSDDYGMYFFLATIMPDVYYCQGIEKKWTKLSQDDLPLPDRFKLGMQPILNQELYYTGNNSSSSGGDKYLWAYQDYGDEYRYVQNKITGKLADSNNNSFKVYTQTQFFASLPNWSAEFATADNVRKDYLSAPSEVAYTCEFKLGIRAVRPVPYRAIPASIV